MTGNQINYQRNVEYGRTNRANEALRGAELAETSRHNIVGENETHRHNVADEGIRTQTNYITAGHYQNQDALAASRLAQDLAIAQGQLGLGYANLTELLRHNQASENLTNEQILQRALSSNNLGGYLYYLSQGNTLQDVASALHVQLPTMQELLSGYSFDPNNPLGMDPTLRGALGDRLKNLTLNDIYQATGYDPKWLYNILFGG